MIVRCVKTSQLYKVIPGGDLSVSMVVIPLTDYDNLSSEDRLNFAKIKHLIISLNPNDVEIYYNPRIDELGIYPISLKRSSIE